MTLVEGMACAWGARALATLVRWLARLRKLWQPLSWPRVVVWSVVTLIGGDGGLVWSEATMVIARWFGGDDRGRCRG